MRKRTWDLTQEKAEKDDNGYDEEEFWLVEFSVFFGFDFFL